MAVVETETGRGDGFPLRLRLQLMREHLRRPDGDDADLRDPHQAVQALQEVAFALDGWHSGGRVVRHPPGRLRRQR